jgi:hypothetical protein
LDAHLARELSLRENTRALVAGGGKIPKKNVVYTPNSRI